MQDDLLKGFQYCVFSRGSSPVRHIFKSFDVTRVSGPDGASYFQFFAEPNPKVPLIGNRELYFFLKHAWHHYPTPELTDRATLGAQFARICLVVLQGIICGWRRLEPPPNSDSVSQFVVDVRSYLGTRRVDEMLSLLGVEESRMRSMCKLDILAFAAKYYNEKGCDYTWNPEDFLASGYQRMPYNLCLLESVALELAQEGRLDDVNPGFSLLPNCVESTSELVAHQSKSYLDTIEKLGDENGWLANPISVETPAMQIQKELRIFIIPGHDEAKRRELKELLESHFELESVVMQEKPGRSHTFIEKFEEEASLCNAAVAIITPDDIVTSNNSGGQPRLNVLFELGWFVGKYGRARTLILCKDGASVPSDLTGIEQLRFTSDIGEKVIELKREIDLWKAKGEVGE